MSGVNKVIILGRLGQDPEVKQVGQSTVAQMSIATSEKWKGKDGQMQEKTEWHRVVVWGVPAENAGKYLKKGREVYVEGRLQTRSWEDQQGNKRYATEVIAQHIQYIGSAPGGNRQAGDQQDFGPEHQFDAKDEIPF